MENLSTTKFPKWTSDNDGKDSGGGEESVQDNLVAQVPTFGDKILAELRSNNVAFSLQSNGEQLCSSQPEQMKRGSQRNKNITDPAHTTRRAYNWKTNPIIDRLKEKEEGSSWNFQLADKQIDVVGKSELRSRYKKTSLWKGNLRDPVQWYNVPQPPGDEQLSRLKFACHYAWIDFSNKYPSMINNNVKDNRRHKNAILEGKPLLRESSDTKKCYIKSDKKACDKTTSSFGTAKWMDNIEAFSDSYKILKLIVFIVLLVLKVILFSFVVIFILYCVMVLHKPTQTFVTRHTQDLIYPFMRTIRFGSLPFTSKLPQLHELYEDACVLANPFFEMNDVSCWPCESVRHVIDLTGFSNFTSGYYHSGIPFIVKDAFVHDVQIEDLYKLYSQDDKLSGSVLLKSSVADVRTLDDLVRLDVARDKFYSGNLHVEWKINRVHFARLMRKLFSRPYYIPNSTETSVQHFLFIDEPATEQYSLPVTEFANVFVMQADGRRLVVLVPVKHCRFACKAISVVLQPKDVLFYNWLFWRPISFPMKAEENNYLSITYVGSFY